MPELDLSSMQMKGSCNPLLYLKYQGVEQGELAGTSDTESVKANLSTELGMWFQVFNILYNSSDLLTAIMLTTAAFPALG